ncbi:MAG: hypothetical protein GOMPHAMPRED_001968 [Gomphillus americanus]|uniref:F-box domain-containing protein n=1 Tax=Gomphillus americanus TaxID=1940652 RepID=A0A8H3INE1_9LECA|nr:MAG: hypothetical protein GOMPHAMPRED_001968 [Gomphillus americanus]
MISNEDTVNITDLIGQFPIFSSLIKYLDLWDLIQLSRTSAAIRYLCHRFKDDEVFEGTKHISGTNIRKSLRIGQHKTTTWKLYKSLAQKRCRELDHTRGIAPLGCKLCSKPVCFACIVKHSFDKHESTFLLRGRALCNQCFNAGNPHSEHIGVQGSVPLKMSYAETGLCVCTSLDGVLCSDCKKKHNQDSLYVFRSICAGTGCGQPLDGDATGARVCLWCNSILPTASQKQQYETSHGFSSMRDDLIPVRGSTRMSVIRRITSAALHGSIHRTSLLDSNETRDATIGSSLEPLPPPNDAEIPEYSQYPTDRVPDYRPPQVQVQE